MATCKEYLGGTVQFGLDQPGCCKTEEGHHHCCAWFGHSVISTDLSLSVPECALCFVSKLYCRVVIRHEGDPCLWYSDKAVILNNMCPSRIRGPTGWREMHRGIIPSPLGRHKVVNTRLITMYYRDLRISDIPCIAKKSHCRNSPRKLIDGRYVFLGGARGF